MPRGLHKRDLPQKTCVTCGRPFTWRRKWAKVWNEVRHCSDACRRARKRRGGAGAGAPVGTS
ncbi:MAG: DUF2256 domain-containing protein [Rhodobacteraceae bacterium]|nr:DUF2256 domain-containing protein [Paracoccaceae bacterium]